MQAVNVFLFDYEILLKVVLDLTKNYQDFERGFRQMVFNVMANKK